MTEKVIERRAEVEAGVLCMIATHSIERCIELMDAAFQRYADKGIVAVRDMDSMKVTLPNGSAVHYVVSDLSAKTEVMKISPYKCEKE